MPFGFVGSTGLFAQERVIKGTVTSEDGPLIGASVVEKDTSNGTITDIDGNFQLLLAGENTKTIVASFVGFQSREVTLSSAQTQIEVMLEVDYASLEEVVVVGYGTKKNKLTGSISQVDEQAFKGKSVTNSYQALQGEAPGLIIQQGTSEPGSVPQINIRGLSTINGNTPLIVVDGVISSLNNVNPNNIESVSVLKDAASAAIYGSRAANGVIFSYHKSGEPGKPKFTYSTMMGIQQPTNFLRRLIHGSMPRSGMKLWSTLDYHSFHT